MSDDEIRKSLIVEEYKSCRDLIGKNIEITERNEVYTIGACAVVFAFSLGKDDTWLSLGSAWLPFALSLIGSLRFFALSTSIDKIDAYIRDREGHYEGIGFTTHYQDQRPKSKLKVARWSVWAALALVSLAFGIYRTQVALRHASASDAPAASANPVGPPARNSDRGTAR